MSLNMDGWMAVADYADSNDDFVDEDEVVWFEIESSSFMKPQTERSDTAKYFEYLSFELHRPGHIRRQHMYVWTSYPPFIRFHAFVYGNLGHLVQSALQYGMVLSGSAHCMALHCVALLGLEMGDDVLVNFCLMCRLAGFGLFVV